MPQYYSPLGPLSHASLTTLISLPTLTVQLNESEFIILTHYIILLIKEDHIVLWLKNKYMYFVYMRSESNFRIHTHNK